MAPDRPAVRPVLSPSAEADIREILHWSEEHFGKGAADRYAELIAQALNDLGAEPERAGS
jgi:toxin ParE1/3/4